MTKPKVITVVGTRPELIRLSLLIRRLDETFNHLLVHTGQNSAESLNAVFFRDLNIRKPNFSLGIDNSSLGNALAEIFQKTERILIEEKPDAMMVLGDTNSALVAILAERHGIPVYHMEAGNRSFDRNVPEEINRKLIDHVATFNLPYSDFAHRNLVREGLSPRFIQKTGSPIAEIFNEYKERIEESDILSRLNISSGNYILVSAHRQENVDDKIRLKKLLSCLVRAQKFWDMPMIVSTHPRTQLKLNEFDLTKVQNMTFHEPFGFLEYCHLQLKAFCVISDSGSISEESSIMGFPAVTLRDSMERQEALETASIVMSGLDEENLIRSIQFATSTPKLRNVPDDYAIKDFSDRVIAFVLSTITVHRTWTGQRS